MALQTHLVVMELEEEKMPQQAQREGGSTEEGEKRRPQPPPEPLRCPRCDSMNTKFCYYNNYSLSQPRYFCKTCKRYWTKGGALRNVPFGGGCRKSKRPRKSQTSYTTARLSAHDSPPLPPIVDNHHQLQQQLFFNKNLAISSAPATNVGVGSMSHPSLYGLGGIEGGGYCGLTLPPIQQFNHGITGGQLVDLHQHLPSLHRHGFMNFQAGSLEGPAPPHLSAMMGATSSTTSQFGWQQRVFSPISATTPTVNADTERNDQQLLWQKNPYV